MTVKPIPEPYHRWSANEDMFVKPFSMKDRCLTCGVVRSSFLSGRTAVRSDAVAAGPCPRRDWRDLTDVEIAPYVIDYIDGAPQTPTQHTMLDAAQRLVQS